MDRARVAHRGEIVRLVSETIRQKPAEAWLGKLEEAGIPAGPINSITQAFADVQAQHRGMVRSLAGVPVIGSPVRLDGERADSDLAPPALGEHTREVIEALGLGPHELERLKAAGVTG